MGDDDRFNLATSRPGLPSWWTGWPLVVVSLREVGHGTGGFRIRPGELLDAFGFLEGAGP